MKSRSASCLLKYRGEKAVHLITRDRAACLLRAARSRRANNVTKLGPSVRRINDVTVLLTIA